MKGSSILEIPSISHFHQLRGLPHPEHPLISIVDYARIKAFSGQQEVTIKPGYYMISIKRGTGKLRYGQQAYDFDEGLMYFIAPNQLLTVNNIPEDTANRSGWMLLIHPDFLWNTALAVKMKKYEFFEYFVNEALFLSEKEENIINGVIDNIRQEYHSNIDKFSQDIIISLIETLLNYSQRFYERQFITRKIANHQILSKLELLLDQCIRDANLINKGVPTVQFISEQLNMSPNYLSGLLKSLTGQSTQQHIHEKLIEKAKEKLSTTQLSIAEIAYELGFEQSQSFSRLFRQKTNQSPQEFRRSFH